VRRHGSRSGEPVRHPHGLGALARPASARGLIAIVVVASAFVGAGTPWWLLATGRMSHVSPVAAGPSYQFSHRQTDGKTPIAYDRCRTIRYVIRQRGEPAGGNQIIIAAVSRISAATGLHFAYDGATSEGPSRTRDPRQSQRYGQDWAPVLFTWSTAKEVSYLAEPGVLGVGGSQVARTHQGTAVYVTGTVSLDVEKLKPILREPNGRKELRALVLHELGHLVGLDHVSTKGLLMYHRMQRGVDDFAPDELRGLAVLGKGECFALE
jgi:hypothetical protein